MLNQNDIVIIEEIVMRAVTKAINHAFATHPRLAHIEARLAKVEKRLDTIEQRQRAMHKELRVVTSFVDRFELRYLNNKKDTNLRLTRLESGT